MSSTDSSRQAALARQAAKEARAAWVVGVQRGDRLPGGALRARARVVMNVEVVHASVQVRANHGDLPPTGRRPCLSLIHI